MEILPQGDNLAVKHTINPNLQITMESDSIRNLSYADTEVELEIESKKSVNERPDSPEACARAETPSSNASTSGVCSMASSDFEYSEEIVEENTDCQKAKLPENPLTTNVPKMNMRNYWERRSLYHRLGPYGTINELDYQKCYYCDFYKTVPKNAIFKRTS